MLDLPATPGLVLESRELRVGVDPRLLWSPLDVEALRALCTIGSYSQTAADLRPAMRTIATLIQNGAPGDWAIANRHGYAAICHTVDSPPRRPR